MIPRKAKRDANEREIVKVLEQAGVSVFRLDKPFDLLLGFRKRLYMAEVKNGTKGYGKDFNENQKAFLETWNGPEPEILRSVDDALDWINSPTRRGL